MAIAAVTAAGLFVSSAVASPTVLRANTMFDVSRGASVPHLAGGGAATSSFQLCYWVGGDLVEDNSIPCQLIVVEFVGRPAGERWWVELYDRGTCRGLRHRIAILDPIRIGANGRAKKQVVLSGAGLHAMAPAMYGRLALGLSKPGYRVCTSFGPTSGGGA